MQPSADRLSFSSRLYGHVIAFRWPVTVSLVHPSERGLHQQVISHKTKIPGINMNSASGVRNFAGALPRLLVRSLGARRLHL